MYQMAFVHLGSSYNNGTFRNHISYLHGIFLEQIAFHLGAFGLGATPHAARVYSWLCTSRAVCSCKVKL